MVKKDEKHYAYFEHETVQAMLHSLFRFQTAMQAQLISNRFADQVILAPKMSDHKDRRSIFLWVRDLDVTPEQRSLGYVGNYAKISLIQLPNKKWTLSMTRVDVPLVKHPVKLRVGKRFPNTGHPLIRGIERGKTYDNMQQAAEALMAMHEEFPEISVPGVNRLRIMMYKKSEKGKSPVQRVELSVVRRDDERYIIDMKILGRKQEAAEQAIEPTPSPQAETTKRPGAKRRAPQPVEGPYTAMVNTRRKRKRK
ncbi:MAG: hypothetical protein SFX19_05885 [Alphaproteobacteria bacterium]|nr:hypothetical protein [Alphaproteobacteria bacterium]